MERDKLKISQFVLNHPILEESEEYKQRYLNILEYFVAKYSSNDLWAASMIELYKSKLLSKPSKYMHIDEELKKVPKDAVVWKIKRLKLYAYKYCLLIDVIFICSFTEKRKSEEIFKEVVGRYNKQYWKKFEKLYLTVVGKSYIDEKWEKTEYIRECLRLNQSFLVKTRKDILVTATMSAGKSTILNAIVGKKINKTQNDACTAKIHYLFNKAFEDTLTYEYDFTLNLDASKNTLMEDNENNSTNEISVGTHFRSIGSIDSKVCFIDTPGVNASQNHVHKEITQNAISTLKFDLLLYLFNGENIGTEDDRRHLEYVAENYKGKIIFVVNKLDRYKANEDSVDNTLNQIQKDLENLGYSPLIVCPVSAYAAYLAKMSMYGEELNDDELAELEWIGRAHV